jgi:hypothetical protein
MTNTELTRREMLAAMGVMGLAGLGLAHQPKPPPAKVKLGSYKTVVLADHPVAYWRLDELKGPTALDATGHHHNGKYHGKVLFDQKGALKSDKDPSVGLTGKAYVEVPDDKVFSVHTSGKGLTVEAWMRPEVVNFPGETADPYVHWLGKGMKDHHEWGFRFYSHKSKDRPNRISAYIWNPAGGEGAGAYYQPTKALDTKAWLHVVATYDPGDKNTAGAGVNLYINGKHVGGPKTSKGALYSTYQIVPKHGPAPLRLGTRDLASFLRGWLDEVAIYPGVLPAARIQAHYQAA